MGERSKRSLHQHVYAVLAVMALGLGTGAEEIIESESVSFTGESDIGFRNAAEDPGSGLAFTHAESPRNTILDQVQTDGLQFPDGVALIPHKPHGAPGVAIFDYDGDGDLDIYVTNSAGAANALFSNRLRETGTFGFVDVAATAGVAAIDHDSSGVCFGDIDNDGDHDLMVLGAIMPNRLFENRGDGTFSDITAQSGVGGGDLSTSSCSMGDVNGDGLLDIAVANTHTTWNDMLGIVVPFTFSEHNQLFLNAGDNEFTDVSSASGFETQAGLPAEAVGAATLTWALALVDIDQDGDVDALTFDDQGAVPAPFMDGLNYGVIHLFRNDGAGQFTDVAVEAGLDFPGNWMGVSFGDYNCDGLMDFFATNVGDYPGGGAPRAFPIGFKSSRWFLGRSDGAFDDPGVGDLQASVFGWGTSTFDADNDGDSDIVYHGALDLGFFADASNPGVLLRNEGCAADFVFDTALMESSDYTRRVGQGLAAGDLNEDGLVDVVTVSNAKIPEAAPLVLENDLTGSLFDATAFFLPAFAPSPDDPSRLIWTGLETVDGDITVELNTTANGNNWTEVTARGTIGLTTGGRVNRDGIGAVVTLSTAAGARQMAPVLGGASYASQDSLSANFGLGRETSGTIEVLWPGGIRNRLRDVAAGERIVFPEIPCDIADEFEDRSAYSACVDQALDELVTAGVLDQEDRRRFFDSAFTCAPGSGTACLRDRRFRVEVDWRDLDTNPGTGRVIPLASDESALFGFFDNDRVEIHVNVLDGCRFNDHFWVFASASTNFEFTVRVTDTVTGEEWEYFNPLGQRAPAVTDIEAFAACP